MVDPIAIDRYVWNKKAIESICAAQGIATVFIFQPTPTYQNPLAFKAHAWDAPGDQCVIHGYPLMAKYIKDHKMGNDFLWLADLQGKDPARMYVDKWHYSPEFSRQIAGEIYEFLQKRADMGANPPARTGD